MHSVLGRNILFGCQRYGIKVINYHRQSAIVVLKHETSTLRQSNNFISINLTFGAGDYVRDVTSPAKFGSDPMSGRDATWGQHIRVLLHFLFLFFLFLYSSTKLQPIPVHNFSHTIVQKTRSGVRKTFFGMRHV